MELNKIYNEDCLQTMSRMPDGFVDLIFTSPPYNLRNTTGGGLSKGNTGKWKNCELSNGYENHTDDMPHEEYVAWQRQCLSEMMRVTNKNGAIFYNHKWRVQNGLLQDRADILEGFPVRQIIIWERAGGVNFNDQYFLPTYEVIYLIAKNGFKLNSNKNRYGDIWKIPQDGNNKHPAPFPLKLPRIAIQCTDAEIIYDPFMGSGTTAIAATIEGRMWVGSEKTASYIVDAKKRLAPYIAQNKLFTTA